MDKLANALLFDTTDTDTGFEPVFRIVFVFIGLIFYMSEKVLQNYGNSWF